MSLRHGRPCFKVASNPSDISTLLVESERSHGFCFQGTRKEDQAKKNMAGLKRRLLWRNNVVEMRAQAKPYKSRGNSRFFFRFAQSFFLVSVPVTAHYSSTKSCQYCAVLIPSTDVCHCTYCIWSSMSLLWADANCFSLFDIRWNCLVYSSTSSLDDDMPGQGRWSHGLGTLQPLYNPPNDNNEYHSFARRHLWAPTHPRARFYGVILIEVGAAMTRWQFLRLHDDVVPFSCYINSIIIPIHHPHSSRILSSTI